MTHETAFWFLGRFTYICMKNLGIVVDEKNNKSQDCYVITKIENIIPSHGMTEFCP